MIIMGINVTLRPIVKDLFHEENKKKKKLKLRFISSLVNLGNETNEMKEGKENDGNDKTRSIECQRYEKILNIKIHIIIGKFKNNKAN